MLKTINKAMNSANTLVVLGVVSVTAAAVAAKYDKPTTAGGLLLLSTGLQAREIYIRHKRSAEQIQSILRTAQEIKKMDPMGVI